LSGVDPNFIEKFIPSMDLVGLSCFLVAPNCHRVTEVPHRLSGGYPLSFVSVFFLFLVVLNIYKPSLEFQFLIWYSVRLNTHRIIGPGLARNWLISGVQQMS
jgi:hypothetical protein